MAKDAKYYAKIGGSWEQQYFETQADQVKFADLGGVLLNGVTDVETALSTINTKFNAASGFAGLDGSGKLRTAQIPDAFLGGMIFRGTVSNSQNTGETGMVDADTIIGTGLNKLDTKGEYLIATTQVVINNASQTDSFSLQAPGDDGGDTNANSQFPLTVEKGDWLVATTDLASNSIGLAIINNTYQDASGTRKGIVTLSEYTDGDGFSTLTSGTDVVTELQLKDATIDNIGIGATNFAAGNHTHSIYYPKTGGVLSGNVTIGDGDTSADLILDAEDDNNALGSASNDIVFKHLPNGGTLTTVALDVSAAGKLQFGGYNVANSNNWNSTDIGIPEITVSTSDASGGKNGDVWIKYTA